MFFPFSFVLGLALLVHRMPRAEPRAGASYLSSWREMVMPRPRHSAGARPFAEMPHLALQSREEGGGLQLRGSHPLLGRRAGALSAWPPRGGLSGAHAPFSARLRSEETRFPRTWSGEWFQDDSHVHCIYRAVSSITLTSAPPQIRHSIPEFGDPPTWSLSTLSVL